MLMARVTIPQLTEKRKASLAAHGLKIVERIEVEEFERVVAGYLERHTVLHLATFSGSEVRSTALEYFNDGLTVFILSEGGGKIANIKAHSRVSYTIADPYNPGEDFFGAAGLQVWGSASVFMKNDDPGRFEEIHRHARFADALKKQGLGNQAAAINFYVITIVPRKIIYLNYREGFRKAAWEQD
jgi:hypothetical protein